MLSFRQDGLEVDSCPECFGVWFDREELKRFVQTPALVQRLQDGSRELDLLPRSQERRCPICPEVALLESNLGQVYVDVCPRCRGIWLDGGEFEQAIAQYRSGQRGNLVVLNQIAEGLRSQRQLEEET